MKRFSILLFAMLASCATPQEDYCARYNVHPGDGEYGNCTRYFDQQQAMFQTDRAVCSVEADRTYPKSLYSRPTSFPVRYVGRGGFGHTEMVHVGADYQQIAEVDRLRMTIIEPCMQQRGWNSGATWTAGRHVPIRPGNKLPWLTQ